jgi:hypothetical protein
VRFAEFFNTAAFTDPTWSSVPLNIWTFVEPGIYLFAACLSNLRPLYNRLRGNHGKPSQISSSIGPRSYGPGPRPSANAAYSEIEEHDLVHLNGSNKTEISATTSVPDAWVDDLRDEPTPQHHHGITVRTDIRSHFSRSNR